MPLSPKKKTSPKTMAPKKPRPSASPASPSHPPSAPSLAPTFPPGPALPLPAFLKFLTSSPRPPVLTVKQAMAAAAVLLPRGLNSPAKLARLTAADLAEAGIADEAVRKGIAALTASQGKGPGKYRRAPRESDLDRPLPTSAREGIPGGADFNFDEITYEASIEPSPLERGPSGEKPGPDAPSLTCLCLLPSLVPCLLSRRTRSVPSRS